ncbi:MAG TPA: histidinol dehydrogenase [Rudaea sp.]|nr:histidinol dehydrogenase [Rudaea sp.]
MSATSPSLDAVPRLRVLEWASLDASARVAALARPPQSRDEALVSGVARIVAQVRADGDGALRALTRRFDGCELADFAAAPGEFAAAEASLAPSLKAAMREAYGRIEAFHRAAAPQPLRVETAPGVVCARVLRPIARVGLYVPAGSAPLPSTALMLGVPARIAHCPQVVMCTPPAADGRCDPAVLYAATLCGIERVFKLGGAQAVAALAFGTSSVPKCDKIFGPGNAWVTEAKRQVALADGGAAIDLPAGPSEVLVVADAAADPDFVAADLLAQAEHGPDSQALLVADDRALIDAVAHALRTQLPALPRASIAAAALAHARLVLAPSLDEALAIANDYAPEHLILNLRDAERYLEKVENAGSVFLGAWSPESVGDYCSGTNHVLPTYGHARAWSGLSVASFVKQITVQELTPEGLRGIGPCASTLATAERLEAHARAVTLRLAKLDRAS